MLEKSRGLLLNKLCHHIAKDSPDSVKALVCCADIIETMVVEENLLHDEDSHSFAKLGTGFHDAKTQRDDFGRQEKVDNIGRVVLDESTDNSQVSQPQILEGS